MKKKIGAREPGVDESFYPSPRSLPVLVMEFEAYPEPKLLRPSDLILLLNRYRSRRAVAKVIGVSEGFVIQNLS